jgi:cell division septation protein DedD
MTDDNDKPASRSLPRETTEGAVAEYQAKQKAERAKMAKLRELRLAAEAQAVGKTKVKRKPTGKGSS